MRLHKEFEGFDSLAELALDGDLDSTRKNATDIISQVDRLGKWVRDLLVFSDKWYVAGKVDYALEGKLPVLALNTADPRAYAFFDSTDSIDNGFWYRSGITLRKFAVSLEDGQARRLAPGNCRLNDLPHQIDTHAVASSRRRSFSRKFKNGHHIVAVVEQVLLYGQPHTQCPEPLKKLLLRLECGIDGVGPGVDQTREGRMLRRHTEIVRDQLGVVRGDVETFKDIQHLQQHEPLRRWPRLIYRVAAICHGGRGIV